MTSKELNEATDRLNTLITEAEAVFAAHFNTTAEVTFGEQGALLVFGKQDREWRLAVAYDKHDAQPLTNASRLTRIEAVKAFPKLWGALMDAVTEDFRNVVRACKNVEEFLQSVKSGNRCAR
jgi:hypothetical protein